MITPQTYQRRTDNITVIYWDTASDGNEEKTYFQNELGAGWEVRLEPWRTISCTDGSKSFSMDRGSHAAKDSNNDWHKISKEQLSLFFDEI